MNLISICDLNASDIQNIWGLVNEPAISLRRHVAWSFEGNGIRTRTTFIRAFRELDLAITELPNFLKTDERPQDLAGYLDPFYDIYVIRESNHTRLTEFGLHSRLPVINAMSSNGHPCEVLTDAYFIDATCPIKTARICLWGPPTNVFRSWHELANVLGIQITQVCNERFHEDIENVTFSESVPSQFDFVLTDGWPKGQEALANALSLKHLESMGKPKLLPTPPFAVGRELSFDPNNYAGFVGYRQKELLLPVQKAILRYVLQPHMSQR